MRFSTLRALVCAAVAVTGILGLGLGTARADEKTSLSTLELVLSNPEAFDALEPEEQLFLLQEIERELEVLDPLPLPPPPESKYFKILNSVGYAKKCVEWSFQVKRKLGSGKSAKSDSVDFTINEPNKDGSVWDVDGVPFHNPDMNFTVPSEGSLSANVTIGGAPIDITLSDNGEASASGEFKDIGGRFDAKGKVEGNQTDGFKASLTGKYKKDKKELDLELEISVKCNKWE